MKIKLKKTTKALLCITFVLFICSYLFVNYKNEIYDSMSLNISRADEYIEKPKTLAEWREISPNVIMVLEFISDGILHNIPVLEVENGDRYMKRNPWGEYDTMGSVFIEREVSPIETSNNWIINGHSSYSKDWNFTFMKNYKDKKYFEQHNTFSVEDDKGYHSYQIVSFAEYDLDAAEENIYLGWFNNKFKSIDEVVNMFKSTEPYILQKNEAFSYRGQQIMTMITCNMKKNDSRFVLVAVKVSN